MGLGGHLRDYLVFPTDRYPAYSTPHILDFLRRQLGNPIRTDNSLPSLVHLPLVFIAFSAGTVGAIGAAWVWRLLGGQVKAFIALDGWGTPLYGDFPIHRLSHDYFTHWSSASISSGTDHFYADPPVPHLDLWRSPHTTNGYWIQHASPFPLPYFFHPTTMRTTAAEFLLSLLTQYGES
jgi:hypothetical protein